MDGEETKKATETTNKTSETSNKTPTKTVNDQNANISPQIKSPVTSPAPKTPSPSFHDLRVDYQRKKSERLQKEKEKMARLGSSKVGESSQVSSEKPPEIGSNTKPLSHGQTLKVLPGLEKLVQSNLKVSSHGSGFSSATVGSPTATQSSVPLDIKKEKSPGEKLKKIPGCDIVSRCEPALPPPSSGPFNLPIRGYWPLFGSSYRREDGILVTVNDDPGNSQVNQSHRVRSSNNQIVNSSDQQPGPSNVVTSGTSQPSSSQSSQHRSPSTPAPAITPITQKLASTDNNLLNPSSQRHGGEGSSNEKSISPKSDKSEKDSPKETNQKTSKRSNAELTTPEKETKKRKE